MSALIPPEFKSATPDRLRDFARKRGAKISADVKEALLDAASEIEGSEEAFAVIVDDKRELQKRLAHTESLLRSAYGMLAERSKPTDSSTHTAKEV
jgi:hypothetical protein